jgi:hypothetical protein
MTTQLRRKQQQQHHLCEEEYFATVGYFPPQVGWNNKEKPVIES